MLQQLLSSLVRDFTQIKSISENHEWDISDVQRCFDALYKNTTIEALQVLETLFKTKGNVTDFQLESPILLQKIVTSESTETEEPNHHFSIETGLTEELIADAENQSSDQIDHKNVLLIQPLQTSHLDLHDYCCKNVAQEIDSKSEILNTHTGCVQQNVDGGNLKAEKRKNNPAQVEEDGNDSDPSDVDWISYPRKRLKVESDEHMCAIHSMDEHEQDTKDRISENIDTEDTDEKTEQLDEINSRNECRDSESDVCQEAAKIKNKFSCLLCEKSFDRKGKLSHHIKVKHNKKQKAQSSKPRSAQESNSALKNFECASCEKSFKSAGILEKHRKLYHTQEGAELLTELTTSSAVLPECSSREEADCKRTGGDRLSLADCKRWYSIEVTHQRKVMLLCTECQEYRSPFPVKLRRHLERMHFKSKHFSCFECGAKFYDKWEVFKHLRLAHGLEEACAKDDNKVKQSASEKMSDKEMMEKYCEKQNIAGQTVWECKVCGKKYLHAFNKLKHHVKVAHLETKSPTEFRTIPNADIKPPPVTPDGLKLKKEEDARLMAEYGIYHKDGRKQKFECKVCAYQQAKFHRFRSHVQAKHLKKVNYLCSVCSKGFASKESFSIHEASHQPVESRKTTECPVCAKTFISNGVLKVHMRTHTGERPFKCTYCGKGFTQKKTQIGHEKRVHLDQKDFACSLCDFRCLTMSDLVVHNRIHTGEKPFRCLQCNLQFRTGYQLSNHNRRHTGAFRQKCDICSKTFIKNAHYRTHMLKHHQLSVSTDHRYNKSTTSDEEGEVMPVMVAEMDFLQ